MKQELINETTISRYKLDKIDTLNYSECIDALQLLNYLFRRTDKPGAQRELESYISEINKRLEVVKETDSIS